MSEVAAAVLMAAVTGGGSSAGSLALLSADGMAFEHREWFGWSANMHARWHRVPLALPTPMRTAFLTGRPVLLESHDDWQRQYPDMAPEHRATDTEATVTVPVQAGARAIGVLSLGYRWRRQFADEQVTLLTTLARHAAQALERGRGALGQSPMRPTAALVADLLTMARLTAGAIRLRLEAHDLTALAAMAIDAVRPAAASHRVLVTAGPAPPVTVVCDAARITQALGHVLGNGVRCTPDGGDVRLECATADRHAVIRVSDTGPGIPRQVLPCLFEPFHRPAGADARPGGLGLGLPIARGLIALHGGTIAPRTDGAGSGAVFEITLPLQQS